MAETETVLRPDWRTRVELALSSATAPAARRAMVEDLALAAQAVEGLGEVLAQAMAASTELHSLAQAYRNDWSDFDGRTLRREVSEILAPLDAALERAASGGWNRFTVVQVGKL